MNRILVVFTLFWSGAWLAAEDLPSLTVAPSDVVRYPDAKDILNPVTVPAVQPAPTRKVVGPLIGSTPVPAKNAVAPPVAPTVVPAKPLIRPEHGWFLVWTLRGDLASAEAWWNTQTAWASRGEPAKTQTAVDTWELAWGPLDAAQWAEVLSSPPSGSRLVKK